MVDTVQFFRLSEAKPIASTFLKSTAPDILCKHLNSNNILAPAVFFSYLHFFSVSVNQAVSSALQALSHLSFSNVVSEN